MGHIINPIGMRLGWFLNWTDIYFVEKSLYPLYLHLIFRIRFYLIYFFRLRIIERKGYFYSHFEIIRKNCFLFVNIFLYDEL